MAFLATAIKDNFHSIQPGHSNNPFSAWGQYGDVDVYPSAPSYASYNSKSYNERDLRVHEESPYQVLSPVFANPVLVEEHQTADLSESEKSKPKESSRNNIQNIPIIDDIRSVHHYTPKGTQFRGVVFTSSTNLVHVSDRKGSELEHLDLGESDEAAFTTSKNVLDSSGLLSPIVINQQHPNPYSSEKLKAALVSPLTYIDPKKASKSLTVPCIPLTTHIHMCLCGELFSYDLNNLQSDPREIIELLKRTGSERGNWMTVGAYYRRQGNPHAAIAVIQSMLKVMTRHGVLENELKPAFLLLSGCESDLSKLTQNEGRITIQHQQKAQKWLQKVYGVIKSQSDKHDLPPPSTHHPKPEFPDSFSSSDEYFRREIQSLRDRLNHQIGRLVDVRSAKRKLENSYNLERETRRRLEREIKSLKTGRDEMRRMMK